MRTATTDMVRLVQRRLEALTAQGLESEGRRTLHRALKALQRAIEDLGQQEVVIGQDPRLTGEQRQACLATVVLQQVRDLAWLGILLREAEAAYVRLHWLLFAGPKKAGGDIVGMFLLEQAIRARCKTLPQHDMMLVYRQALVHGHEEIVRALVGGPGEALVGPSMQEALAKPHVQATQPEAFRRLEDLQLLRQELGLVAEQTQHWLRELGADPTPASDAEPAKAA